MSHINDKWIAQAQADGEASEERRMNKKTPEEIRVELTDLIAETLKEHCDQSPLRIGRLLQIAKDMTAKRLREEWPDDLEIPEATVTMDEDRKVTISFPLEQHQVDRLLEDGWFLQHDITVEPEFKINKIVMVAPWEVDG